MIQERTERTMNRNSNTHQDKDYHIIEAGWYKVGSGEEQSLMRTHWFNCNRIKFRQSGLFLTGHDARSVMVSGAYGRELLRYNNTSKHLRYPDDIFQHRTPDLDLPVTGINWHEAEVLCRLRGGRLATEKEVDLLLNRDLRSSWSMGNVSKIWTSSEWNPFSYCLCIYNPKEKRWEFPEHCNLPKDNKAQGTDKVKSVFDVEKFLRSKRSADESDGNTGALIVFDCKQVDNTEVSV